MASIRLSFLFLFFFARLCTAQQEALIEIINSDEAREVVQQKIDSFFIVNKKIMSPKLLADSYHDLGNKWYYEQWWSSGKDSDIENAIVCTEKALKIKLQLKDLEKESLHKTYFNLGVFYSLNGEVYSAIENYALVAEDGNDIEWTHNARLELGYLYLTTGDFYKALDQFSTIVSFNDNPVLYEGYASNLIDAEILKAETYAELGLKEFSPEIRLNLNDADSLIDRFKITHQQFRWRIDNLEGNRLLQNDHYDLAIAKHKSVLKDSLDLRPLDVVRLHNNIGYSQLKLKNFKEALRHLQRAIFLDNDYSLPFENLGDLFLEQNNFKKALFNYQKAIVLATSQNEKVNVGNLPSIGSV